jgi:nucleoside-diphosphate-sugar epimerase
VQEDVRLGAVALRYFNVLVALIQLDLFRSHFALPFAVQSGLAPIFGDGEQTRDFVYVEMSFGEPPSPHRNAQAVINIGMGKATACSKL